MPIDHFNSGDRFRSLHQRGAQPQKQYFSQPSGQPRRLQFGLNKAVIKSRGPGIFPSYYECGPQLLLKENRRKKEPEEIPAL